MPSNFEAYAERFYGAKIYLLKIRQIKIAII